MMTRAILLLPLSLLAGCAELPEASIQVWKVLAGSQLHVLAGYALLWGVAGGLLGLLFGLLLFFLLRRLGAFTFNWRHAKWLRVLVAILMVLGWTATIAATAAIEGALRKTDDVLRENQFGTEVLPILSDGGAAVIAIYHYALVATELPDADELPSETLQKDLETFTARFGELVLRDDDTLVNDEFLRKLAVVRVDTLMERSGKMEAELARHIAKDLTEAVNERLPDDLRPHLGPLVEGLLVEITINMVRDEIAGAVDAKIPGASEIVGDFVAGLPDEAAKNPPVNELTFDELSTYFGDAVVIPFVLLPIRYIARAQQFTFLAMGAGITVGFILLFFVAERVRRWRQKKAQSAAPVG